MAIKNIHIPPKKDQDKPIVICEFTEQDTNSLTGSFEAQEADLKKAADAVVKSITRKKEADKW